MIPPEDVRTVGGEMTSTTAADPGTDTPDRPRSRRRIALPRRRTAPVERPVPEAATTAVASLDIAPNDPVIAYFQTAPGAVELASLTLESPAVEAMRAAGVTLVVPLVASGELVGLLQLGPRLSER